MVESLFIRTSGACNAPSDIMLLFAYKHEISKPPHPSLLHIMHSFVAHSALDTEFLFPLQQ
jgi:hypothetical protein